ncbi:hypothetical protein SAMN05444682_115104 [Parapedobacter indicus]|uniref:Uncharacterized protein n=1 Tax=Parapedobacter indicus TaxID=1477437 RepID=A0A1I3V0C1_9SPHI|nr:hypothetical protein CLV26_11574 [Parapedobacter indicus]SFJ87806.1 hypothetical protein SAMN05444682_115104 [Parapedobacter indicus]
MTNKASKFSLSIVTTEINIKVTEEDMTRELVKEIENTYITPDEIIEITPALSQTDN